ncbi:ABC transporter ATP-binding protein [Subtercola lobariae]|uniref:High-affinity branched-chain amino acid transport ATP-binding protein n=1 Tax=Subtercola lobariae TaxID=1588641 RepID=A0A917BDV5_9MICO|nr:ABC transporter ATP-binding protein [Subtercola lobariae]GGF35151.1 high-affinity branched-chain amino acid transport ATP-binding protein [Subtercola lobariae]
MSLVAKELTSGYGKIAALHEISIELVPGTVLAVVGANGAGKSTLAKTLAGSLRLQSGDLELDGKSITRLEANARARHGITLVPEGRRLFGSLTVAENIALGSTAAGSGKAKGRELVATMMESFPAIKELTHRRAGLLSGGEQQMVAMMRAAAANPRYLILDEPSLGLSPLLVDEVLRLVGLIATQTGAAILLIEQFVDRALRVADNAIVLQRGRVVARGTGAELRASESVQEAYLGG